MSSHEYFGFVLGLAPLNSPLFPKFLNRCEYFPMLVIVHDLMLALSLMLGNIARSFKLWYLSWEDKKWLFKHCGGIEAESSIQGYVHMWTWCQCKRKLSCSRWAIDSWAKAGIFSVHSVCDNLLPYMYQTLVRLDFVTYKFSLTHQLFHCKNICNHRIRSQQTRKPSSFPKATFSNCSRAKPRSLDFWIFGSLGLGS